MKSFAQSLRAHLVEQTTEIVDVLVWAVGKVCQRTRALPSACSLQDCRRASFQTWNWVSVQRLSKSTLSEERTSKLNELGFDWDPHDTAWEEGMEHFQSFIEEYGHCDVPPQFKSLDGYKLGSAVRRWQFKEDMLRPEQKEYLNRLGFDWDPLRTQWENGFKHLREFVNENKHCRVPRPYKSPDGYRLGGWVGQQRHNSDTLPNERKERLDALGFDWDPFTAQWENGFKRLREFVKENKHCRVLHPYKSPDGHHLGAWVRKQRQKRDTLLPEQIKRLDTLGFDWEPHTNKWEEGFRSLQEFVTESKHCRVPATYKSPHGYRLGSWVSVQRLSKNALSAERILQLDALGFDWEPHTNNWEEGFRSLQEFVIENKHCRVPVLFKALDGYRLGQWVSNQRAAKDTLEHDRRQRLELLQGWSWDALAEKWDEGFSHLKQFSEREGHCRVPALYLTKEGYRLGGWVVKQRTSHQKMSPNRRQRLEALPGWVWKVRK